VLLLPEMWPGAIQAEDVDAAIAHECAHMQRRDFAKNLLYQVLTLPIAYHPATWVLRGRVVETREMVCDAMAAEAVAGRERYARSLLRLAANLVQGPRGQNLHAIGIFDANNFERRVMKLTMKRMKAGTARRVVIVAACMVAGAGMSASAMMLRMQVATPAEQTVTVAVPKPADGQPPQSLLIETTPAPVATASASPAPMRIRVVTPTMVDAPQAAPGSLKVGGGVMAGQIVSKVTPVYPQEAKDEKITGAVVLKAVIGKDGTIENLQVLSGPKELAASALDAVRQWVYKPYLLNGEPVEVETTITVNYQLAG